MNKIISREIGNLRDKILKPLKGGKKPQPRALYSGVILFSNEGEKKAFSDK